MHGPGLRRREPRADARDQEGRANTFHDLELRWNAPWEATVAIGANNVFDHVGPVLYSQPSANVPYSGQFDIGRFVYMKYQQRFWGGWRPLTTRRHRGVSGRRPAPSVR